MIQIKKQLLEAILELCRNAHPREVGGLLLGKRTVGDYVLLPGKFYNFSIYIWMDRIPIYPDLAGTFHSHPSPSNRPSQADLNLFGEIGTKHLVIAYPYDLNSIRAYDSLGKDIKVKLV